MDRCMGIDGFDVEKSTFDFSSEINGAPAKHCSVPENRDASISSCKRIATHSKFRSFSSTSIDRRIGIDQIGVGKTTVDFLGKIHGAPAKNCSGPENRDASILLGRHVANAMIFRPFSIVFEHRDRSRHRHRSIRRRKNDVPFL